MQFQKVIILPAVNNEKGDPLSLIFWKKIYEGENRELNVFLQIEARDPNETKVLGTALWEEVNTFLTEIIDKRRVFSSSEEVCEKIIKVLNRYLLAWGEENELKNWNDLHILIGTANPSAVCFTRTGDSHLVFWRNNNSLVADENLNQNRSPQFFSAFSEIVGGSVRLGDRFLITSPSFSNTLSWEELSSLITHADVRGTYTNIYKSIEGSPNNTAFLIGEISYSSQESADVMENKVKKYQQGGFNIMEFNPVSKSPVSTSPLVPWKEILKV